MVLAYFADDICDLNFQTGETQHCNRWVFYFNTGQLKIAIMQHGQDAVQIQTLNW